MASAGPRSSDDGRSVGSHSSDVDSGSSPRMESPLALNAFKLSLLHTNERAGPSAASPSPRSDSGERDVFASEGGILTSILSFLPRPDLCAIARVCRSTAAATRDDYVWMRAWKWTAEQGRPARAFGSWRVAHMYQALYARPDFTRAVVPESSYEDVTCHLFTQATPFSPSPGPWCTPTVHTRVYGFSDGRVRVLQSLPTARDDGTCGIVTLMQEYALGTGSVRHMQATASGGRIWVGTWQGCVHCINTRTHAVTMISPGTGGPVYGLRIVPTTPAAVSAHLYTGCSDGVIRVMCAQSSTILTAMQGHTAAVTDFCVQKVVQAGDAAHVTAEVELDASLLDAFNPRTKLPVMTASRDHSEASSGSASPTLPPSAAASPILLTPVPAPRGLRTADEHAREYARDTGPLKVIRRLVSTSYDGTIRVWNLERMQCVCVLRGHRGPVWSVQVVGDHIITGGADGTVRLWLVQRVPGAKDDALEGTCLRVFDPYTPTSRKQVWCLQLVGDYVFSGTSDGYVHCWDVWTGERMWVLHAGVHVDHDGIRRIHVDKSTLYACTAGGFVVVFEMSSAARGLPPVLPVTAMPTCQCPVTSISNEPEDATLATPSAAVSAHSV